MTANSPSKRYQSFVHALEQTDGDKDDISLQEVRLALQQQYSDLTTATKHTLKDVSAREKWKWAFKQVTKKKKTVSYFRSSGSTTNVSEKAVSILLSTKNDEDIQSILKSNKLTEWNFNVFTIKHKYPLMIIAYEIMIKISEFHKKFNFSEKQFITFLYRIENEYNNNDYHSAYHA
eukprot:128911_1